MNQEFLLPRSTPERHGISSGAILSLLDAIQQNGCELHSIMISRHGNVVAQGWWAPYRADAFHMLYSLSKSFTSTAAGFAVSEGLLSVDDTVLSFFPDKAPAQVSDNLASMRVRDLLTMTTGHDQDTTGTLRLDSTQDSQVNDWVRTFLAQPVDHKPGTHFVYNSGATYMVSAIIQKVTGQKIIDYLGPRLFEPLGITNKRWEESPQGINTGGWGLFINTETIAKFGQLYLDKGVFGGRRVLPQAWIEEATSRQVSNGDDPNNDWNQGYGYQFWRCRHNAYRGDGAFGQYCVVMPDQEMVVAITAGVTDMAAELNLIWEHLLPGVASGSLPDDEKAQAALSERLKSLKLPRPEGEAAVMGKTYRFAANNQAIETVRFDTTGDDMAMTLVVDGAAHTIRAGRGTWIDGETSLSFGVQAPFTVYSSYRIGASAAANGNTLTMRIAYIETPFTLIAAFRFHGNEVALDLTQNVAFHNNERPTLIGVAEE